MKSKETIQKLYNATSSALKSNNKYLASNPLKLLQPLIILDQFMMEEEIM